MMDRIVARVEQDPGWRAMIEASRAEPERVTADAIAAAARQVCHTIGAKAVVAYTASGATALRVARERPEAPIICLTPHLATARRMAVVWGAARDGRRRCALDERGDVTRRCAWRRPKASPSTATRSSWPPACRSAIPAPPIRCGLRRSGSGESK